MWWRRGKQLRADLRQRERDALELNDNVLQGLVVAKLAFELDERERAMAALDSSIKAASRMVSDVLGPHGARHGAILLRTEPAVIEKLR
jgi:hypothetical protein